VHTLCGWWDAPDHASQHGLAFQFGALQPCLRSFPVFWNIRRSDRECHISLDALQRSEQGQASGASTGRISPPTSLALMAPPNITASSQSEVLVLAGFHPPAKRRLTSIDGAVVT
jgi:hypothetical protein